MCVLFMMFVKIHLTKHLIVVFEYYIKYIYTFQAFWGFLRDKRTLKRTLKRILNKKAPKKGGCQGIFIPWHLL